MDKFVAKNDRFLIKGFVSGEERLLTEYPNKMSSRISLARLLTEKQQGGDFHAL